MSRSTLARHRFQRTSAEGGGGGQQTGDQQPPANDPPKDTGPVEATDPETGIGLGFPKDTKVDDMNAEQRANYWRNQTKVQQKRVPGNLAELQASHEELQRIRQSEQTPAEQELQKVRQETEARVRAEVSKDAALTNLKVILHTRGKSEQEVDGLVEFVDTSRFLTQDGKVDTARVIAYADSIVPAGTTGRPGGIPGQGNHGSTETDRSAAGRQEADKRFKHTAASGKSSLLPQN